MTQLARLTQYLHENREVTQLEAFNKLGICRLSERARELQARGIRISKRRVTVPSRYGKATVTAYRIGR